jgi:hypothetical protein
LRRADHRYESRESQHGGDRRKACSACPHPQ